MGTQKFNRWLILTCAVAPIVALAPPTLSAPAPALAAAQQKFSAADVNARAAQLVDQGMLALRQGDAQAALENFLDARSAWERQGIRLDVNDPVMYAAVHGCGIACLAQAKYQKAAEHLDRAYPSKVRDRALVINRALLDYVQHTNVQRATKDLLDLFAKPDAKSDAPPRDEPTINLFGACVGYCSQDPNLQRGTLYADAVKSYDKVNKELEATRPGQRRWGPEWVNETQFKIDEGKFKTAKAAYDQAVQDRDRAAGALQAADEELGRARSTGVISRISAASQTQSRAQGAFNKAKADVPAKWAAIPWPAWPKSFPPALPDAIGGGTFGSPGPANSAVAIATPAHANLPGRTKPPSPPRLVPPSTPPSTPPGTTATDQPPPTPPTETTPTPPAPQRVTSVLRNAVAFPVGPDLLLTAAAPLDHAAELTIEDSQGDSRPAELVRKDEALGVALLRVRGGRPFRYLNLAATFTGGEVTCWGFPDVAIFNPVGDAIAGTSPAGGPKGPKPTISLRRNPRIPGGPVVDKSGALVGMSLGDRDAVITQVPLVTLDQLRTFLGPDAPTAPSPNPDPAAIWQLTASRPATQ